VQAPAQREQELRQPARRRALQELPRVLQGPLSAPR
jgi:hypothetical protein